eukprot:TRINITY_DN13830_c0_g1_i1.p3 TRINITY_DN13830_c0_g1~~TRINITY_DN13830_c0_g1_i1.p3  ORF type:complete len:106 (-),score=25.15 TRINITY_DN13830_c0_g1_i1:121-438(-)
MCIRDSKFTHGMVSHFTSENSFAQFKVSDLNTIVGFGSEDKHQIIIASKEGKYYLCEFNPEKGGEMKKKAEKSLLANPQYLINSCLLYTSPSPRDLSTSRMPSSA